MSKEIYLKIAEQNQENLPIFYQPWWLDIVCGKDNWGAAVYGDSIQKPKGVWPYYIVRKFGAIWMMSPVLTPFLGPYVFYPKQEQKPESKLSYEKKVLSHLADSLPKSQVIKVKTPPSLENWLPLYWKGFRQTTNYTYQTKMSEELDLLDEYTTAVRSDIKKVVDGLTIEKTSDASIVYDLSASSYQKQGDEIYFDRETFLKLDKRLAADNTRTMLVARRSDGTAIAAVYVFYSNGTAYLPIIGRGNLERDEKTVVKKLLHEAIKQSSNQAKIFDFEGSMVLQFEKVFRSFGSKQIPYHVLSRTHGLMGKVIRLKWNI